MAIGSELKHAGIDLGKAEAKPTSRPEEPGLLKGLLAVVGRAAAGTVVGLMVGSLALARAGAWAGRRLGPS